jgi:hypothetical protein
LYLAYSCVAISDLDSATIETWRSAGVVYLVGSYVSVFPPTNLPAGWDITQALWQRILRKSDLAFLGRNRDDPKDRGDLVDIPFEAVMHCYPNRTAIRPIIQRLLCAREPNPIHRCLFSSLKSGLSKGLITTNYDLAFDSLAEGDPDIVTVFDPRSFDDYRHLRSGSSSSPKVYFKIHGTAAPGAEETIVCDLQAEGWLDPWKRDLLLEITRGRTLILLGYSGRDFDICPELVNYTEQAHTVWLQRSLGDLQPNARRVLSERRGIVVEGDLIDFLRTLLDPDLTVSAPSPQTVRLDDFDPALTGEWRLQILNWIACPTLLYESSSELRNQPALKQSLLGHCGLYRDAVRALESELAIPHRSLDERLHRTIDLCCARFIYGQHLKAWTMLNLVDRELYDHASATDDLRAAATEARMIMYMRAAQVSRALRLKPILRYIQRKADPLYQRARATLQKSGAWGRLEALQQNAERIGVATADGLPLPARRGYRSLGLVSMDVIMKRDWIRSGCWRLTPEKECMAQEIIAKAEKYGWHHEAWKLNWILLFRGTGDKKQYFLSWRKHFRATQYPRFARILQFLLNLVPTGPKQTFEEDHYWN